MTAWHIISRTEGGGDIWILCWTAAGVINVSSGVQVTMRQILDRLIAEFAIPVSVAVDSARLRASEVQKFSASPKRLRALVGERALVPLVDTLRDIVAYERATFQTV